MRPPPKGFTLIEALIVLCVVAILLAIAVPAWSNALAAAHSGAVRADLAASLLAAIRHSSLAGSEVVICPVAATAQCSGAANWDQGWMAFADLNGNRIADANETRLGTHEALPHGVHLRSTQGRKKIVFQPNGGNAGSNITLTLCDARGVNSATTLVLSNTGNLRGGKPTSAAASNCVYGN
ncbi:GspH/FimT family pseudopilin [Lysobacter terrae]